MTDSKKSKENRRKLLKSVAAGGGAIIAGKTLPEKWTRPVVDSVLLPAHAQTSGSFSGSAIASLEPDSLFAKALETLIPSSHASDYVFNLSWCIARASATTANVYFLMVEENIQFAELWSATDVAVGSTKQLTGSNGCASYIIPNDEAGAGKWLMDMGLINDAQADPIIVQTKLDGLNPGDTFKFKHSDYGIDFAELLVVGPCGPKSVENCKGSPPD